MAIWPPVLVRAVNACAAILGRQPIQIQLAPTLFFAVLAAAVGMRLVYGMGFFFVAGSFVSVTPGQLPYFVGLFTLAQVAGFLALFAPGGIGVREGLLLAGLQPLVGPGPAIVITAVARLWHTGTELIFATIGWRMLRQSAPPGADDASEATKHDNRPDSLPDAHAVLSPKTQTPDERTDPGHATAPFG